MNKKLFSGLALMSVAATAFWACGEGNINGKDLNDDIAMASNEQDLQTLKDNAIEDCRITPDCYLKYQGYLEGTDVRFVDSAEQQLLNYSGIVFLYQDCS